MGQSAAETVREIEQTRAHLEQQLHKLEERIPPALQPIRRFAGVALGGGLGGMLFWMMVRKMRGGRRKRANEVVVRLVTSNGSE